MNINHKVKSIRERSFQVKYLEQSLTKGKELKGAYAKLSGHLHFSLFNKEGFLVEGHLLNEKEEVVEKITYKYDSNLRLIEERRNFNFFKARIQKYQYNKNGLLSITTLYWDEKEMLQFKNDYSEAGVRLKSYNINTENEIVSERNYEYDERGNITREFSLYGDGRLMSDRHYQYDIRNNRISYLEYVGSKKKYLSISTTYKYDKNNNLITSISKFPKQGDDVTWSYEYDYDKYQNWIKRYCFLNNKPQYVQERTIKYFK